MSPEIRELLEMKVVQYNKPDFIDSDPISIPHRFTLKEDVEISGFLAATIAWGKRASTIKSASKMMELMGNAPYDFTMSHSTSDLERLDGFVHRTFNASDLKTMIAGLREIYQHHGGMESFFREHQKDDKLLHSIHVFRNLLVERAAEARFAKHVADPMANSAAKRINLFLRWMVRNDGRGVDFGIWKSIRPAVLSCPLDVHSGRTARKLGLVSRKYDDGVALAELDACLRSLDASDPAKYDFALFGLGIEGF